MVEPGATGRRFTLALSLGLFKRRTTARRLYINSVKAINGVETANSEKTVNIEKIVNGKKVTTGWGQLSPST
ncbi:hypothetical protein [Dickeya oryzae]|uniref:hypothetical protein n=1 Tax=Dickeya oryzae TaxID=1240404 RepID=UPI001AECB9D8|nr:hypothetical protein [Dickeya oryzae]MBP2848104.1 hypothetical protein [Dickeya oryzae]